MPEELKIASVLKNNYAIEIATTKKMEGYDSINFKINTGKDNYVLKIYSHSEQVLEMIGAESELLLKLEKQGISCSKIIATKSGALHAGDGIYIYRLLSYLSGTFLAESIHSNSVLESFGVTLAQLDLSLFQHHNSSIKAKETPWDLKHFQKNWKYLEDIPNASDRSLVDYFCLQFNEYIIPHQYELRQGLIHNDANDWNVLVGNEKVTGIIDFGDMCHSWIINELAVGLTYMMMGKDAPLEVAHTVIKAYHKIFPLEEKELDCLYYLVAARLCTSVLNSAHSKKSNPDSAYITISEKAAWKLLKKWLTINPILAQNRFRTTCDYPKLINKSLEKQLLRRYKNTSTALSLSYANPIQMWGAAFQYMYDSEGNTFLDAYNNIIQVGHCHPKVVRAGQKTMAKLNTNTRYLYDELLSYTDKLLSKFPSHLNKVFLVNSGSAASDLAIRIAKTHTDKKKVMVLEHGYHGNTQKGIDISHYKYHHKGGTGKKFNIIETGLPKYFGSGMRSEEEAANHYVQMTLEKINQNKGQIAAFIAEPIVGCGGQVPLPKTYLRRIYAAIREQGGLCISDEVQVGFGRLGHYFWGYEMYDVEPDIVILGKPIGNGHPVAAVVTTEALSKSFDNGMEFFSSFGGNPVSCAIGEAVLTVIEEEKLSEKAHTVGEYLKKGLKSLQLNHPELADIRGSGLFLGVEILDGHGKPGTELASSIKNELRERHILISTDGPYDNVLKIKPPLYFDHENVDLLVQELGSILKNRKKLILLMQI
jgi:4-aminobutyrate aminotransferase-like enzyme/Ser/Thr protein kinase RdoA (MazF antagonist)